ncbi:hypothetical protein J3F84DRAFT_231928 [Trichoderma pleuroticola]
MRRTANNILRIAQCSLSPFLGRTDEFPFFFLVPDRALSFIPLHPDNTASCYCSTRRICLYCTRTVCFRGRGNLFASSKTAQAHALDHASTPLASVVIGRFVERDKRVRYEKHVLYEYLLEDSKERGRPDIKGRRRKMKMLESWSILYSAAFRIRRISAGPMMAIPALSRYKPQYEYTNWKAVVSCIWDFQVQVLVCIHTTKDNPWNACPSFLTLVQLAAQFCRGSAAQGGDDGISTRPRLLWQQAARALRSVDLQSFSSQQTAGDHV